MPQAGLAKLMRDATERMQRLPGELMRDASERFKSFSQGGGEHMPQDVQCVIS